jgi:phosphoribosylaminoimidazolecarboxamide formyltransferase/IMP cyclohydrolase
MTKRALLSVSNKDDLVSFARQLVTWGWELVASGGTAAALRAAAVPVRDVAEVTGAPEMLGGRVKTLHPAIHAGILARDSDADRADLATHGFPLFDLVACNLYPFAETAGRAGASEAEAVEQIDIGGVALLRAAAKNYARVTVVCDPSDYATVLAELERGGISTATRRRLAAAAFAHTRDYDAAIARYFAQDGQPDSEALPAVVDRPLFRLQTLRYGENPHQAAALYATDRSAGPLGGRLLGGKELSYNNLLDLDAALHAAEAFEEPAVVIVKHLSPCGLAVGPSISAALPRALASDPVSAFGGVIAANRAVGADFTDELAAADLFVEAIIAPAFTADAQAWLAAHKKNCRLVALEGRIPAAGGVDWRSVRGGWLAQTRDMGDPESAVWSVVSRRQPSPAEATALRFAWLAVQHVKSNAIVFASDTATVGIGGGQPSRVDAVKMAAAKAGERAVGAVMASDAFFPFADGLEVAAAAGVTAVIEPGGSVRDEDVIAAADRLGLALVFTGARHFRH